MKFFKQAAAISYQKCRNEIKDGDILMYKGNDITSKVIATFTKSDYSHAGIAVWWNKRLMVMEAVSKGIIVTPLSANIKNYNGDVELYVYKDTISDEDRRKMIICAQDDLGKKYNMFGVIWMGIKILFKQKMGHSDTYENPNQMFCSQYVAKIYNSIGIDLNIGLSDAYTCPDDIVKSDGTIRKGALKIQAG